MKSRGIRNNNPLNIRRNPANHWVGARKEVTDKTFEEFVGLAYGYRAAFILLHRYICQYGKRTIAEIVGKWAPAGDGSNNPAKYARDVSQMTGYAEDQVLSFLNREEMVGLAWAMSYVECGEHVPRDWIEEGYSLALRALGYKK